MKPLDDNPLRISKWPFYLGDALLVATALAIGILGGWDLSAGEVFACVLSVALGAGLFVLPYLYEYTMRLKEESDDVEATFRVLGQRIERIESRMSGVEAHAGSRLQAVDLTKALEPLEKRLSRLESVEEKTGTGAEEQLVSLAIRLGEMEKRMESSNGSTADKPVPAGESSGRVPRKRPSKQNNLLHRAIQKEQEPDLPAVSRIIEAVPNEADKEAAPVQNESASAEDPPEPDQSVIDEPVKPEPPEKPVAPAAEKPAAESAAEPTLADLKTEAAEEAPPSGDLFGEVDGPSASKRRKRKGKNDSVLTVNALIGIGNKPYLRGSGGGLNWETGLQMDFRSIGKWEWTAPDMLEEPIEVQVYCNDRDPDQNGKHTLQPGGKLEISPEF